MPQKGAPFFALSCTKLVLIRNNCYQCKLVCTDTMTEWCKILTIKTLTEVNSRGGVEDTTLEAKAKDTQKSEAKDSLSEDRPFRGQAQECSRPRPRTKDTATSVLKKKKSSKSFSGNLQFIGGARIFDWGGLNHKLHAMTSSKICLLALEQDFAKGERLT